jgi:hypothetical protein
MNGSIDKAGNAVIRWNIQDGKFYSPDGTQHCLPCETCGDPQWVSLPTVSVVCNRCAEPDPDLLTAADERMAIEDDLAPVPPME